MRAALYARFSTDKQRDTSIDDQMRECERVARAAGLEVVARFQDKGISGGTAARPGYQALLAGARRREFEVIVTEDISRLWRNRAEFGPRSAELEDLGIHWVSCVGQDTRRDGWGLVVQILQAMAEHYRREAAYRTRRGLEGVARSGKPAGGRSYGYIPATKTGSGRMEIDEGQAQIVRRIFEMYAAGHSPRAIAATLNRDGVPAPGSTWERQRRRRAGWVHSVIAGNPDRGLGILNNDLYRGVVVWNRSKWIRSAADSSKRRQVQNPRSEWITHQDERLRIVSQALWDRVKARQTAQASRIGARVRRGMSRAAAARTGAGPKYLVSGLLRCGHCGSNYAIAGRGIYKCSGHTSGGVALCANDALLHREEVEAEVLAGIKRDLRSPAVIEEICRRVRSALRAGANSHMVVDHSARIAQLRQEAANLADAIACGGLRASPTIAGRLAASERELERLLAAQATAGAAPVADVPRLLADLRVRATQAVDQLERTLAAGDIARARAAIKAQVGMVTVEADAAEIRLYSEQGSMAATLLRAVGADASLCGSGGRI